MQYNSHTIQSTHLKCTTQWFLVYSQSCTLISTVNFRTFHHPKKKPFSYHPPTPNPSGPYLYPHQPYAATHLLSVSIDLPILDISSNHCFFREALGKPDLPASPKPAPPYGPILPQAPGSRLPGLWATDSPCHLQPATSPVSLPLSDSCPFPPPTPTPSPTVHCDIVHSSQPLGTVLK